jgi:hypothetical protein
MVKQLITSCRSLGAISYSFFVSKNINVKVVRYREMGTSRLWQLHLQKNTAGDTDTLKKGHINKYMI